MNHNTIRYILGLVLKIESLAMILPFLCSIIYKETSMFGIWTVCIIVTFAISSLISIKSSKNKQLYAKDGFACVALSWIVISIFASFPFVFSGYIPNFIDALFESVSGFTTTGASILTDVESLPKSLIFWRSFTHWLGGMGVLVFLMAFIPLEGGSKVFLLKAESTGPSVSKLVPRVKSTATILYGIYIFLTILEIVLLLSGGMNLFESLTLSFGTAGTGGFGILNTSVASYSSYSQIVITIFMILFGVDFSVYYFLILGKFRQALKSEEVRGYFLIILSSIILICINCANIFTNIFDLIKHSSFQVASVITTTGFSTYNYDTWPEFSKNILIILMFFGACAGSTGGGIKISRIIILFKTIVKEIKIIIHPKSMIKVKFNKKIVEHDTIRAINVYMIAYALIYALSVFIVSIDGFDFTTNFTSVCATLNNIGPGLSKVGPIENFMFFSPLSKIVFIFDMLIGRLEIFPMLVLFSPYLWKK